jgi:anti-anti-sigma factor
LTRTGFGVGTSLEGFVAVLTVRGEIDISSAPELDGYLEAAIDQGHRFVTLDVSRVTFLDGAGLRSIGRQADRLAESGGALTIRAPSQFVLRLLDIVGMSGLVRIEPLAPEEIRMVSQEELQGFGIGGKSRPSALTHQLREIASIPAGDDLIAAALRLVVALASVTVGGADGVSVSLRRHGQLATVAASDHTILAMDANQYETGEGPCIDASVRGQKFHAESLETETRWPDFTPKARALGINAILSSPLQSRDVSVGALNIYSFTPAAFSPKDQELASVFASEASLILTEAGVEITDAQLDERLGEALRTRTVIAMAQGMIMQRDNLSEDDAYTTLRRFSVESGQLLREHAGEIVASAQRHRERPTREWRENPDG